eukprot:TRINITY_DN898_c0_g1_i1.p1 TRINITY_DN898_c0_g1~~TRINITY_DN898_c0_g1_i1.p1  ORF type:complete len:175 (+),score=2.61 TRINITY_DN898_c0_g1_i1:94-618(+)
MGTTYCTNPLRAAHSVLGSEWCWPRVRPPRSRQPRHSRRRRGTYGARPRDQQGTPRGGDLRRLREAEARLGEIVNRPIFFAMARALCAAWWALPPGALVVLDVPLLFETVVFPWVCEGVVVVTAPEAVQRKRPVARNGYAPAHAQARIDAQMPQEYGLGMASETALTLLRGSRL